MTDHMVLLAEFLHLISIKHGFLVSVGKVVHNLFVSLPENDFKELFDGDKKNVSNRKTRSRCTLYPLRRFGPASFTIISAFESFFGIRVAK